MLAAGHQGGAVRQRDPVGGLRRRPVCEHLRGHVAAGSGGVHDGAHHGVARPQVGDRAGATVGEQHARRPVQAVDAGVATAAVGVHGPAEGHRRVARYPVQRRLGLDLVERHSGELRHAYGAQRPRRPGRASSAPTPSSRTCCPLHRWHYSNTCSNRWRGRPAGKRSSTPARRRAHGAPCARRDPCAPAATNRCTCSRTARAGSAGDRHGSARGPGHRFAREVLVGDEHHAGRRRAGQRAPDPAHRRRRAEQAPGTTDTGREAARSRHQKARTAAGARPHGPHRPRARPRARGREGPTGHGPGHGRRRRPATVAAARGTARALRGRRPGRARRPAAHGRPRGHRRRAAAAARARPGDRRAHHDCSPGDGQGRCAALVVAMSDGPRAAATWSSSCPSSPGHRGHRGRPRRARLVGGDPDDPARTGS